VVETPLRNASGSRQSRRALCWILAVSGVVMSGFVAAGVIAGLGLGCESLLAYVIYPVAYLVGLVLVLLAQLIEGSLPQPERSRSLRGLNRIGLVCLALGFVSLPLQRAREELSLRLLAPAYDAIVRRVEQGELQPDGGWLQLPRPYRMLSVCGGRVAVDGSDGVTRVLFLTYRGALGEFRGSMYRADGLPPAESDFDTLNWWSSLNSARLRPGWYRVSRD